MFSFLKPFHPFVNYYRDSSFFRRAFLVGCSLFFLPLLAVDLKWEQKATLLITVVVAFYWVTETFPLPVTSLMPIFLFPLFKVLHSDFVAKAYVNDTIFMFIGASLFSVAMRKYDLHKRISLALLSFVGDRPRLLVLGVMSVTATISMFLCNATTTTLMISLVLTVLDELKEGDCSDMKKVDETEEKSSEMTKDLQKNNDPKDDTSEDKTIDESNNVGELKEKNGTEDESMPESPSQSSSEQSTTSNIGDESPATQSEKSVVSVEKGDGHHQKVLNKYSTALLLGVAYSASIGGVGTMIGAATNLTLKQQLKQLYPNAPPVSFGQWFLFGFPLALFFLFFAWGYLCVVYIRDTSFIKINSKAFLKQYKELNPLSFVEGTILGLLLITVILWFTLTFGDTPGWNKLFDEMPGEGTVAIITSFLLFVIPSRQKKGKAILDWSAIKEISWGIVFLLGAGFAIASAFSTTGLAKEIGQELKEFANLPPFWMVMSLGALITVITEFASNVAIANISLPILASIAARAGENPLLLMIPGVFASNFSFMFPVATPPNSIVFSYGNLSVLSMALTGSVLNLFGIIVLPIWMFVAGQFIFDIDIGTVPDWAIRN